MVTHARPSFDTVDEVSFFLRVLFSVMPKKVRCLKKKALVVVSK